MGEIIYFPKTPGEPIPPRTPGPGEKIPENVIFPEEFQRKSEREEEKVQPVPESGKELARSEVAKFWEIWETVQRGLSGKSLATTNDGWDYHKQNRGWSLDISQTDPQEERDGVVVVRLTEKEGTKQTLTSLRIASAYWETGNNLRRERVDILQEERTGKKPRASEPWEASVGVLYDEEGKIITAWRKNSDEGLNLAYQLAEKAVEKLSRS